MSQKNKKRGKNQKSRDEKQKRDLLFAEENQMYAKVEKMLGNCRLIAKSYSDSKSRLCHIRGKLRKRVWIREGSVILIALREFEDDKADVIHCYLPEEVKRLVNYEEIDGKKKIPLFIKNFFFLGLYYNLYIIFFFYTFFLFLYALIYR